VYGEGTKFSRYAVYAESPLATPANLVELRINLADGSSVNGITVSRIDAASFASTLQLPEVDMTPLFDGDHSTVAITTATNSSVGPLTYVSGTKIMLTNTATGWGTESSGPPRKEAYLQIRSDQKGCPAVKCTPEDICYTAISVETDGGLYIGVGDKCNFFYRPSTEKWYGVTITSWGWVEPFIDEITKQWTAKVSNAAESDVQAQWPTDIVPRSTLAVAFDLKAPLEATGGRLLVEDGAPSGLALYGSNDAGQNWTRVASLVWGEEGSPISSEVEMLSSGAFVDLPPLSRGGITGAAAIEVDESDSAAGEVLVLGGFDANNVLSTVHLVDLATGACARQPDLLHSCVLHAAARLPDGRIICAGGFDAAGADLSSAEVWGPPAQGGADAAWSWTEHPAMSAARIACCGCVMSDGCFAVLGGYGLGGPLSSCEAQIIGDAAHWEPLPPMHDTRGHFACAAVAGCVIVAGGFGRTSAEVYDESRNRWLRLPHGLPYENELCRMSSALL
jgi:hypothetical protein